MYCRSCGAQLQEGAVACIKCGLRPLDGTQFCNACGAETRPQAVVCTSCGAALAGKATTQVNAALAGILNWLWGGVAYFLLGQTTKGIVFSVLTLCMWILSLVTCGIGFVIFGVYDVVLIIDAVMLVGRANRGESLGDWQFF